LLRIISISDNPFGDLKSLAPSDNRFNKENGSIIAVSYEARAKGVTRSMRGDEAMKVSHSIDFSLLAFPFPVFTLRLALNSY
jgi:hypothetical protein